MEQDVLQPRQVKKKAAAPKGSCRLTLFLFFYIPHLSQCFGDLIKNRRIVNS